MKASKLYQYILGALVTLVFFLICVLILKWVIPTQNHDAAMLLLGGLAMNFNSVVGFFFGSSKGSEDKTDIINTKLNPDAK